MPLDFVVTPSAPLKTEYVSGVWNHYAYLSCRGVLLHSHAPYRLSDHCQQNKAVLYGDPLYEPLPPTLPGGWYKRSMADLVFKTNAKTTQDYFLKYSFNAPGYAKVAFYINGVHDEQWTNRVEGTDNVGLIIPCPAPQTWTYIYMFLVSTNLVELKKVDCSVF